MFMDAAAWAESEFRGTPGLNARFQTRLVHTAMALATRPQGTMPTRFDWAELKGAYRLVHAVTVPDTMQQVHRDRTRERVAAVRTPVLFIHDTTHLDFSRHAAVADQLGPGFDFTSRRALTCCAANGRLRANPGVSQPKHGSPRSRPFRSPSTSTCARRPRCASTRLARPSCTRTAGRRSTCT